MQHYKSPIIATTGQPVIVYIDIKSPYAFVALKPTFDLERELGVQFDWRPLTLDIPSYLGSAKKRLARLLSLIVLRHSGAVSNTPIEMQDVISNIRVTY